MSDVKEKEVKEIASSLLNDYEKSSIINTMNIFDQPDSEVVTDILNKLLKIIFPGYFNDKSYKFYNINSHLTVLIEDVIYNLKKQSIIALGQSEEYADKSPEVIEERAETIVKTFFAQFPKIREYTESDVEAAFSGDPAAYNYNEIVLCYPGLRAITINRIAHELYLLKLPIIPRMMTEYAHRHTGIDIHPGTTIGKYFFIDHGTGIVIGETSEIGDNVKIYQGVTIGALSTRAGQSLRGVKRHPTIEDNVTIYSGASILGGETVIGKGAVIGSNAFITTSIDAGAKVSIKNQELNIRTGSTLESKSNNYGQDDSWYYTI